MTWDMLLPHIPHRHAKLLELLDVLAPQMCPGVGVIIYHDNLQATYGEKCQTLLEASSADYVSFLSNDDSVSPDYVNRICEALESEPDYVGYWVRYTIDGVRQEPTIHSLQYDDWGNAPNLLYRDITQFNPIRRDLAMRVPFRGHSYADRDWATDLRALGCVKSEVFIDDEMYYYQWSPSDFFESSRRPVPEEQIPSLPDHPFVRYI